MSGLKPSQLISRAEIDDAYDKLHEENEKLRMLLWLRHGCDALYGNRTLIEKVQDAQVEAGERAVMDNLKRMGF